MGTIAQKLAKLLQTKHEIKQAIADMGQSVGDVFSTYPDKIRQIRSGLNTDDATATANDLVLAKTAYAKGQKITGTVQEILAGQEDTSTSYSIDSSGNNVKVGIAPIDYSSHGKLFRYQSKISTVIDGSNFGNAGPADVTSGKTFTSSSGYRSVGTLFTYPENNINSGYTFSHTDQSGSNANIYGKASRAATQALNSYCNVSVPLSNFGNAGPADVTSGKTFTSSSGIRITGTGSSGGGSTTATFSIENDSYYTLYIYCGDYSRTLYNGTVSITTNLNNYMVVLCKDYKMNYYNGNLQHINRIWDESDGTSSIFLFQIIQSGGTIRFYD